MSHKFWQSSEPVLPLPGSSARLPVPNERDFRAAILCIQLLLAWGVSLLVVCAQTRQWATRHHLQAGRTNGQSTRRPRRPKVSAVAKVSPAAWRQFALRAHAAAINGLPADCSHAAEAVRIVRCCLKQNLLTANAMHNPLRQAHLAALLTYAAAMIHGPTNSSLDAGDDWEDICFDLNLPWDEDNDRNFAEGSPARWRTAMQFAQTAVTAWALEQPHRFGQDSRCSWAQGRQAAAAMGRAHAMSRDDEERAAIRRAVSLEWALFEAEAGASGRGPPRGARVLRERMLQRLQRGDETAHLR